MRVEQAEEIDFELGLVFIARDVRNGFVGPLPLRRPQLFALVQQFGGGLETLMLEQATDERASRGSSSSAATPAAVSGRGSSILDLMWISVAAMTRNSPAMSRFSSVSSWIASRYCCVMSADRDVVWTSTSFFLMRCSSRSIGPSN